MDPVCQVAVFQPALPPYRLGIFRRLSADPKYRFTFFIPRCGPQPTARTSTSDGIRKLSANVYGAGLPFCSSTLKIQPASIWRMFRGPYDVLVMGNDILALDVWLSALLSRVLRRQICLWGHGFSRPNTVLRIWWRRRLMNLARAVIFYCDEARQSWIERGVPAGKLFVAPNALDTDEIARNRQELTTADLGRFRIEQGVEGKKCVVFCGRLVARKRPEVLLEAMALVVKANPNAHAFIIGAGPLSEGLKRRASELGLKRSVSFIGEVLKESLLAKVFMCSQVAVIPSAAGLGIQHAFGYGVPIVCGDGPVGHGPEISLLTEGVTGFFCRSDDPASFARRIDQLLRDESLQRRLGANGLRLVEAKFTITAMARGFLDAVEHCSRT